MSCTHLALSLPRKSNLCLIITVQISHSTPLVWVWFRCEWDISQSKENISLIRNRSHQPASKKHLDCAKFSGVCSAGWPMTDHVSVCSNTSPQHRNNSINIFPSRKDPILGSGWGPAPRSQSGLIPQRRHEYLTEQCSELPKRKLTTDVRWSWVLMIWVKTVRSLGSAWATAVRKGHRRGGGVSQGFTALCTGRPECVQRCSLALRCRSPLKLGEISWQCNTIIRILLRMGQNQWLCGTPAVPNLGRVVGAQVSGLLHVHRAHT